jgi:monofunctional biosynthetic peptidoglycan transglycosylase
MLPAPKRFERQPGSPYVMGRAALIMGRMNSAQLP